MCALLTSRPLLCFSPRAAVWVMRGLWSSGDARMKVLVSAGPGISGRFLVCSLATFRQLENAAKQKSCKALWRWRIKHLSYSLPYFCRISVIRMVCFYQLVYYKQQRSVWFILSTEMWPRYYIYLHFISICHFFILGIFYYCKISPDGRSPSPPNSRQTQPFREFREK